MASSIVQQLQAIKSTVQADSTALKRPFTRPSILYDPKEAADIDVETIFNIALSGLEVLTSKDERFRNYTNDIFSHKSVEYDRELKGVEENNQINITIGSYLKLLSGYLQLDASLRTLEYLIRRYKIYLYNQEDLILCAMPYHDTHAFVRIIQLIDAGNSKWKFLDAVKKSGAPLPRTVIVQQCIRDMGVLEVLCTYGSSTKKYQPSKSAIIFLSAVVVEVLGSSTTDDKIDNNAVVKRILPFIVSGLQTGSKKDSDHKASALMIVGMLANKVELNPKLVKSLICSIAEIAREDAKELADLQGFRLSLLALINLVQMQSINEFPKKALGFLKEAREVAEVVFGLSNEYNIDRFLALLLETLVENSISDDSCHLALLSIIEIAPIRNLVGNVVVKVLTLCLKLSHNRSNSTSPVTGSWARKILDSVDKKYPSEYRRAIRKFFEDQSAPYKKDNATFEILSTMLDGCLESSTLIPDSRILLALNHPKAEVRRASLSCLKISDLLQSKAADSQIVVNIQEAVLSQLHDEDLTVVHAALSIDGFSEVLGGCDVLEVLQDVLQRCYCILMSNGGSNQSSLAVDVAYSFLKIAISGCHDRVDYLEKLAAIMFPFVLTLKKSHKLNLKVLELAKEVEWPLYSNLCSSFSGEEMLPEDCQKMQKLDPKERRRCQKKIKEHRLSTINMVNVATLAENFSVHPDENLRWFIERCSDLPSSKFLLYLVLMQLFIPQKNRSEQSLPFLEACFSMLKTDCEALELLDTSVDENLPAVRDVQQFSTQMLDSDCSKFLDQLIGSDFKELNTSILVCVFWRLLEAMPSDVLLDDNHRWDQKLREMFVFFSTSRFKCLFKLHIRYLVTKSKVSPGCFLCHFFTEEGFPVATQIESLHCFSFVCAQTDDSSLLQLLTEFPSVLVPLASNNQDTRIAAMGCIEGLHSLCPRVESLGNKNGKNAIWNHFLDEFLGLIIQQKRLILSDEKFLPSFLSTLLGSSDNTILVPRNLEQRFDQSTKETIAAFIVGYSLKLSAFAKLAILSLLKGLGNAIIRIKDVESLLCTLLERRNDCSLKLDKPSLKLSKTEVDTLCLLLEKCAHPDLSSDGNDHSVYLLKALQHNSLEDSAGLKPCITILRNLSGHCYSGFTAEMQELIFHELVVLFRHAKSEIQNATKEALLRLNITSSIIVKTLKFILASDSHMHNVVEPNKKRKSVRHQKADLHYDVIRKGENDLLCLSSLLDILMLKKDISNRYLLIGPLFRLFHNTISDDWLNGTLSRSEMLSEVSSEVFVTLADSTSYIQQTVLIVLEDIVSSLSTSVALKDDILNEINVGLLLECVHSVKAGITRNHIISLLTSIAKVTPDIILEHILDILTVVGESTVSQIDSHSQRVFEEFISVVVPCWLSKKGNAADLLQIFVTRLPEITEHRRLSIVVYLLRTLGECKGLASLIPLLFRSLVSRKGFTWLDDSHAKESAMSFVLREWEYAFTVQMCDQYSCMIWLPCLVRLLDQLGTCDPSPEPFMVLLYTMELVCHKLHGPELGIKLDSGENLEIVQTLGKLMERVVPLLGFVDAYKKHVIVSATMRKALKERMNVVLRSITIAMIPSAFFGSITSLLSHVDWHARKKALGLLCETVRKDEKIKPKHKKKSDSKSNINDRWSHMNEDTQASFHKMCKEIIHIVESSVDEAINSLKLSAISAMEVLAERVHCEHSILGIGLAPLTRCISSHDLAISSSSLRACGVLVDVLGTKALARLPEIMQNLIKKSVEVTSSVKPIISSEPIMLSILSTLEAVINKLGGFLNPYLQDIMDLMLLCPEYVSGLDPKLKLKADALRKLLTDKVPVRLALPPLLKMYSRIVESGDSSIKIAFDMLAGIVCKMDRSTVAGYHGKIFDLCLSALDLRRLQPVSIQNINDVEKDVIGTMFGLTMKLTETLFRPLFIRSIEWAESDADDVGPSGQGAIDRAISFYGLVNKLAENHRSLFVPYFKYLLEGCVRYLTDGGDTQITGLARKKKKTKLQDAAVHVNEENNVLAVKKWHLRALILSSLHKCFLYDTGSLKFLDSSNFQVLLKPMVSQLVAEPPITIKEVPDIPSVKEVDDLLVVCLGQMAVTAGSDLLWKPLNHEVLMQTRSEKMRARILGLRIVRYLVDNLKEEYSVLFAETIPFLGELLEDSELTVKSLAQDVIKEMELMSGESLGEYL